MPQREFERMSEEADSLLQVLADSSVVRTDAEVAGALTFALARQVARKAINEGMTDVQLERSLPETLETIALMIRNEYALKKQIGKEKGEDHDSGQGRDNRGSDLGAAEIQDEPEA